MSDKTFNHIVWAIDPFAEDMDLQVQVGKTISALVKDPSVSIEPVNLIQPNDRFVSKGEGSLAEIENSAKLSIDRIVKASELRANEPKIFLQEEMSMGSAVGRLVRHAKEKQADLIAVGSMGKKGASRFLLGSFAENLILVSDVPALVVSPNSEPTQAVRRVLYPTDLTSKSREAFSTVVQLAKEAGATIVLFHRAESTAADVEKALNWFEDLARRQDVKVETILQRDGEGTRETILKLAGEAPGTIVAMVSRTALFEMPILGTITRQVIRHSPVPVWVIHPKNF